MVRNLGLQVPLSEQHQEEGRQHRTGGKEKQGIKKFFESGHVLAFTPNLSHFTGGFRFPYLANWGVSGALKGSVWESAGPQSGAWASAPSVLLLPHFSGMISLKTNTLSFLEYFSWLFFS